MDIAHYLVIFVISSVISITLLCIYELGREFGDTVIFIIKKKMDLLLNKENKLQ